MCYCLQGGKKQKKKTSHKQKPVNLYDISKKNRHPQVHLCRRCLIIICYTVRLVLNACQQTLPLQLARTRHPHGTQEGLLSAASFPT